MSWQRGPWTCCIYCTIDRVYNSSLSIVFMHDHDEPLRIGPFEFIPQRGACCGTHPCTVSQSSLSLSSLLLSSAAIVAYRTRPTPVFAAWTGLPISLELHRNNGVIGVVLEKSQVPICFSLLLQVGLRRGLISAPKVPRIPHSSKTRWWVAMRQYLKGVFAWAPDALWLVCF